MSEPTVRPSARPAVPGRRAGIALVLLGVLLGLAVHSLTMSPAAVTLGACLVIPGLLLLVMGRQAPRRAR
ncbi:hypothetical protein [Brachybacterium phenoliresistens]|uniref:Uncharacterized protein n=1 Tax=Brachybacterium phenoliresistens TaxID=396014 RepID=Z9JUF2_9MICO|nr:hypothetical protein [Brachybacterium phenoliresistens]EWS81834.1 hypothetical protein BF93_14890 [Brachybacterium phenoliresistens]